MSFWAILGSLTRARIFRRMNSVMVALASGSTSTSEVAHPDPEAGLAVELLVERLALLRAHFHRLSRVGLVDEAPERVAAAGEDLGLGRLDARLGGRVDLAVPERRAPVWRPLVDGQVADGLGDLGDGLHAGGAGADH